MFKPDSPDPISIAISTALYRLLLACYPAGFRTEYAGQMAQLFRDSCARAQSDNGLSGLIGLWGRTLLDWSQSLIEEWSQRETEMTQPKFLRLSGWALILGGICLGLGTFVQFNWIRLMLYRTMGAPTTLEEYNHYRAMAENIGELPSLAGLLLVVVGIHGLRICYREKLGKIGQSFLDLSFVGGVVSTLALLWTASGAVTWGVFVTGFVMMFGSLALFGLVAGKKGVLPPIQATLLLSGLWFPLWIVPSFAFEYLNGGKWIEMPSWIEMPIWVVILTALILLGQALQSEARIREVTGSA